MITPYLKSLAATVRDLVASGKAVHVTNETAAELDLLAGLPWGTFSYKASADIPEVGREIWDDEITPADLALGWLLASRAPIVRFRANNGQEIDCADVESTKRAAECAELAIMAARLCPELRPVEPELSVERVAEIRAMLAALQGSPVIKPMEMQAVGIDPHDGTREGARAAWGFVVGQLQDQIRRRIAELDAQTFRGQAPQQLTDPRAELIDRYRRELEAV